MLVEIHQQLYHTLASLISIKTTFKPKRIFGNNLITQFLGLTLIKNRIKYKWISINSFITHFLSLIAFRNKLYCRRESINSFITKFLIFWIFCKNWGQTLTFHRFHWFHPFFRCYVDLFTGGNFLTF